MALVVMKFGGSSVADADKMKHVAGKIVAKSKAGNKVVAVVSAPGDTTDNLLEMASKITSNPPSREMDMLLSTGEMISISLLAMAIDSIGARVISMTGPQREFRRMQIICTQKLRKSIKKKLKISLRKTISS